MDGSAPLADALRRLPSAVTSAVPLDTVHASRHGNSGLKRAFDVLASTALLVLCAPLMLLIAGALAVAGGPVLFSQPRVGRSGRLFDCYKFRTMVPNADERLRELLRQRADLRDEWARDQKLQSDPRVTAFGSLLRRSSLDELPQLFNVLLGDMSLVGPRPVLADELVARYGRAARWYAAVRPGITGLWQVKGRNHVSYRRRVALDCYYARRASPFLDFSILLQTFNAVLAGAGPSAPRAAAAVEPTGENMRWAWTVVPLLLVGASAAVEWLDLGDAPRGPALHAAATDSRLPSRSDETGPAAMSVASNQGGARPAPAARTTPWSRTAPSADAAYHYAASDGVATYGASGNGGTYASSSSSPSYGQPSGSGTTVAPSAPSHHESSGALGLLSSLFGALTQSTFGTAAPAPVQMAVQRAPVAPAEAGVSAEVASTDDNDGEDEVLDEAPNDVASTMPWWCDGSYSNIPGCSG